MLSRWNSGPSPGSTGQTVRRTTDRSGQLLEIVTDSANRIVSTRRLPGQP